MVLAADLPVFCFYCQLNCTNKNRGNFEPVYRICDGCCGGVEKAVIDKYVTGSGFYF